MNLRLACAQQPTSFASVFHRLRIHRHAGNLRNPTSTKLDSGVHGSRFGNRTRLYQVIAHRLLGHGRTRTTM